MRFIVAAYFVLIANTCFASTISYEFDATITPDGVLDPLLPSGIGPGDTLKATFLVAGDAVSSGDSTYGYYPSPLLGGSITIANKSWVVKPAADDFVLVWDGADAGSGHFFDVFWVQSSAVVGDSLNNLAPWYIGFSLFSDKPKPNNAIVDTKLPLQLNLSDFNYFAQGSFTFGDLSSFGRFNLAITNIVVKEVTSVPEPSGLVLMLASLFSLFLIKSIKTARKTFRRL